MKMQEKKFGGGGGWVGGGGLRGSGRLSEVFVKIQKKNQGGRVGSISGGQGVVVNDDLKFS